MKDLQVSKRERVSEADPRLYSFASLEQYSLGQRMTIRAAGFALFWLIRIIGATLRYEVTGAENHTEAEPLIYCCWHNRIPIDLLLAATRHCCHVIKEL